MEMDLFTFVMQVINFCILLFFLNRFLFSKIRNMMEERNVRINKITEETKIALSNAEKLINENRKKEEEFEAEKENERAEFVLEMEALRNKISDELNAEISSRRAKETEIISKEVADIREEFLNKCAELIRDISDKVLKDVSGEELNRRVTAKFIEKISKIENIKLIGAEKKGIIKSSFELLAEEKILIEKKLEYLTGTIIETEYTVENESGLANISLSLCGKKIEISFDKYLDDIVKAIADLKDVK